MLRASDFEFLIMIGWIKQTESASSTLIIFALVEMFSGEGQFIVQPLGEKNLIEAGTSVFKSR